MGIPVEIIRKTILKITDMLQHIFEFKIGDVNTSIVVLAAYNEIFQIFTMHADFCYL